MNVSAPATARTVYVANVDGKRDHNSIQTVSGDQVTLGSAAAPAEAGVAKQILAMQAKPLPERIEGEVAKQRLAELPESWQMVKIGEADCLRSEFKFPGFKKAVDFGTQVCAIGTETKHFPAVKIEFGRVTVDWFTHDICGLQQQDFDCAARTSALTTPPAT